MTDVTTAPDPETTDPQDTASTAPESDADGTDETVPEVDIDAMLETVKAKDLTAYGVLNLAAQARKTFQNAAKALKAASSGNDNFESLCTKHSDDEQMGKLNKAVIELLNRVNQVREAQRNRLAELGETSTAVSEQEKAALKEERKVARTQLVDALNLFRSFATQVPSVAEFLPLVEKLEPPKLSATAGNAGSTEQGKIREWAKANGLKVNDRGRISAEVIEKYNKANAA